jgi:hypothetical protein
MRKLTLTLLLMLTSLPVTAQESPIPTGTPWSQPHFIQVDATFSEGAYHARWDISRCACGDLHIAAEETLPGEIRTGEQLLVGNRALLVRGYKGFEGELAALLDSPVLMMQLVFVLLQRAEPSGPSSVTSLREANLSEPTVNIELDSGVAQGFFPAPWALSGTIGPAQGNAIRYQLKFSFDLENADRESRRQEIPLTGRLVFEETPFPVEGEAEVDGWWLAWVHGNEDNHPGLKPGMTLTQLRDSLN